MLFADGGRSASAVRRVGKGVGEQPTSRCEVVSYFPLFAAKRSTMTASAPSPVTLQAVPKLSMAM